MVRSRWFLTSVVLIALALPLYGGGSMAKIVSITDGNSMVVEMRGASAKVRMHGVVVPPADEARPILNQLNKESVAFLKRYLADGWVYLEFPSGSAKQDENGFIPAYVYHGPDAEFINEKLVAEGLAIVNQKEKNEFTPKIVKVQNSAKGAYRGIWGSFASGGGDKIASGAVPSATYIGVPGATERRGYSNSYVTYWIFLFE
jgi:endonuclease YncB( thermonuclease family)